MIKAIGQEPSMVALGLTLITTPLATDAYLAGIPDLQRDLEMAPAAAQATLAVFLVGFAVGQLVGGPTSDRRGRRPMILIGLAVFSVAGLVTALALSAVPLLVARAVQGLAGGASAVAARSVIADAWTGRRRAEQLALVSAMFLIGPAVAPVFGGLLLAVADWRVVMALPVVLGCVALVAASRGVPETRTREVVVRGGFVQLLHHGPFRRQLAVSSGFAAANFAYVAGSPFFLRDGLGLDASQYGAVFGANAVAMIAGTLGSRRLLHWISVPRLQLVALVGAVSASSALTVLAASGPQPLQVVWPFLAVISASIGAASVATASLLQDAAGASAGAANGMQGALIFVLGAAIAPVSGLAGTPTLMTVGLTITACFVVALAAATARTRAVIRYRSTVNESPADA